MLRQLRFSWVVFLTVSSASFAERSDPLVITIDIDQAIFFNNAPTTNNLSELTHVGQSPIVLRIDKESRYEAVCKVLAVLAHEVHGPVSLGASQDHRKAVHAALSPALEAVGGVPLSSVLAPAQFAPEPTSISIDIEFDGTTTLNHRSISPLTLEAQLHALKLERETHVYVIGDRLTKAGLIEDAAAEAKRSGFRNITVLCRAD